MITVALSVIFILLVVGSVDIYIIKRRKWNEKRISPFWPEARPAPGVEATGELSIAAKYAIWSYMFSILGIGGAVVGVIAGVAGYMINDLAKERSIQVALTEMQKPLADRLAEFADAKSALTAATKTVLTEDFRRLVSGEVERQLIGNEDFKKSLSGIVAENGPFRAYVADALVAQHSNQLRGPVGVAGPAGKDGASGTSPSLASVVEALNDDGAFRARIADALVARHPTELRGPVGVAGPAGKDGASGTSPSLASVAEALNDDGTFRARIADALVAQHSTELRGPVGVVGPAGKDGTDGINPKPEDIAVILAGRYTDRFRGPQGAPGANGRDGSSPSSEEIAKTLIANHSEEIRRILIVHTSSRPTKKRLSPRRRRPR